MHVLSYKMFINTKLVLNVLQRFGFGVQSIYKGGLVTKSKRSISIILCLKNLSVKT
jgi:hypothetical protein